MILEDFVSLYAEIEKDDHRWLNNQDMPRPNVSIGTQPGIGELFRLSC